MAIEEDEKIELPSDTLAALKDFYEERDTRQKQFEDLKVRAEYDHAERTEPLTMAAFAEDWNASQFWYSQETADALAHELLQGATEHDHIAFLSAPSAFLAAKNILVSSEQWRDRTKPNLTLFEFDNRFAVFKEFVHYDYNSPLQLPQDHKKRYMRIICDPPFLSDECQTKAAMTVRWLAVDSPNTPDHSTDILRVVVCTGERMESLIHKLYAKLGVQTTSFVVQHQKGLSNEFRCYASWTSKTWKLLDS